MFKPKGHHTLVGRAAGDLGDGNDIERLARSDRTTAKSQLSSARNSKVAAASVAGRSQHEFFVGDRVGGVRKGRSDSFTREMRIRVQHIRLAGTLAELSHG